jgi:hypothetical protein
VKITYNQIEPIIEKLIILKRSEWKMKHVSYEDVAQEIRIFCNKIIDKIDFENENIERYLNVCIHNFIKNYIRNKYFYYILPCVYKKCNFYVNYICTNPSGTCYLMEKFLEKKSIYENINYRVLNIDDYGNKEIIYDKKLIAEPDVKVKIDSDFLILQISGKLSDRQFDIYKMKKDGYSVMDISNEMGYKKTTMGRTVRYHLGKVRMVINEALSGYYK